MMQHTIEELKQMQALPLSVKIAMTKSRIREWVREFGEEGVYISFSGGKDSTVLLDIARQEYPNLKAVFLDTGLEYPEIREFVKKFDNVDWVKPQMSFKQVVQKYGYPIFSKEIASTINGARKYVRKMKEKYGCTLEDILSDNSKGDKKPIRFEMILGTFGHKKNGVATGEFSRTYDRSKYKFMLKCPYEVALECCDVMKKRPASQYEKETGRHPIIGTQATESKVRKQKWLEHGCNAFELDHPKSMPLSFWTEQDVLKYIYDNNLPIASVYGKVVPTDNQISLFPETPSDLKLTGVERTGCMWCLFGIHMEKSPNRLEQMKETHPHIYEYIMKPTAEGGLGYKDIIDWINENGGFNIKY